MNLPTSINSRFVLIFSGISDDNHRASIVIPHVVSLLNGFQCNPMEASGTLGGRDYRWHAFEKMEHKLMSASHITSFDFRTRIDTNSNDISSATYMIDTDHKLFAIKIPSEFGELCHWLNFAKLIVQQLEPEYGYGLFRDAKLSPMLFTLGLSNGGPPQFGGDRNPSLDRSHWASTGCKHKLWRQCVLRDIYPYNFLSPYQLDHRFDNTTLDAWITADSGRGQLTDLAGNMKLWSLTDEQQQVVKNEFEKRKLIFHWQNYQNLS